MVDGAEVVFFWCSIPVSSINSKLSLFAFLFGVKNLQQVDQQSPIS
jgi:hypothetical protein